MGIGVIFRMGEEGAAAATHTELGCTHQRGGISPFQHFAQHTHLVHHLMACEHHARMRGCTKLASCGVVLPLTDVCGGTNHHHNGAIIIYAWRGQPSHLCEITGKSMRG